jgi:hypothetical protein
MTKLISFAALAALMFGTAASALAQSADFQAKGLPISLHQAQLTGFADIEEAAPGATLVAAGMPASPHQVTVLSPRRADSSVQVAAKRPVVDGAVKASTEP